MFVADCCSLASCLRTDVIPLYPRPDPGRWMGLLQGADAVLCHCTLRAVRQGSCLHFLFVSMRVAALHACVALSPRLDRPRGLWAVDKWFWGVCLAHYVGSCSPCSEGSSPVIHSFCCGALCAGVVTEPLPCFVLSCPAACHPSQGRGWPAANPPPLPRPDDPLGDQQGHQLGLHPELQMGPTPSTPLPSPRPGFPPPPPPHHSWQSPVPRYPEKRPSLRSAIRPRTGARWRSPPLLT